MLHSDALMILCIGLPILSGLSSFFIPWRSERVSNGFFGCAATATLASALGLTIQFGNPLSHAVGGNLLDSVRLAGTFQTDGLARLLALLVAFVGLAVVAYSTTYFRGAPTEKKRFLGLLVLFQGSMLGCAFADSFLTFFTFWELTGITSFLLVGFANGNPASIIGARMALIVTSGAGLCLLTGLILLGSGSDTETISGFLHAVNVQGFTDRTWFRTGMTLVFIGGLGKSALFPFHFWLPSAMTAPTPASAYLHSATMVKLGVFLLARFHPALMNVDAILTWIFVIGVATMVLGTGLALISHDLKQIFAYTTIAQLAMMFSAIGMPTAGVTPVLFLHIFAHALYKAPLFMVAGLIDHSFHSRDVRTLSGLSTRSPMLAAVTLLALISFLGFPYTPGGLSKLTYSWQIAHLGDSSLRSSLPVAPIFTAISFVNAIIAARVFGIFLGTASEAVRHTSRPLWRWTDAVPFVLMIGTGFLISLAPLSTLTWMDGFSGPTLGLPTEPSFLEKLENGGGSKNALSVLSIGVAGILAGIVGKPVLGRMRLPRFLDLGWTFNRGIDSCYSLGRAIHRAARGDKEHLFLMAVILSTVLGSLLFMTPSIPAYVEFVLRGLKDKEPIDSPFTWARLIAVGVMGFIVVSSLIVQSRLVRIILITAFGFLVGVYFVMYKAPDLALTQFLVEIANFVLLLILFSGISRQIAASEEPTRVGKSFRAAIAVGFGLFVGSLVLLGSVNDPRIVPIGNFYLENTIPLAHGANAVNTILVDFRGLDTFFEITVLVVSMLGCVTLLIREKTGMSRREGAAK